jgi:hypothetical protein
MSNCVCKGCAESHEDFTFQKGEIRDEFYEGSYVGAPWMKRMGCLDAPRFLLPGSVSKFEGEYVTFPRQKLITR